MGKYCRQHIGKTFNEGKLTVVDGGDKRSYVKVKCSVCAEDPELFEEGLFDASISSLNKGCLPCGCSSGRRFGSDQYAILVNRKIQKEGLELDLLEVYGTGGRNFVVVLFCKVRKVKIKLSVTTFLSRGYKSKVIGTHISIKDRIDEYNQANKDSIVWQVETSPSAPTKIAYYCRVCERNNRESVYECLSNSLFNRKSIPCRCVKRNQKMTAQDYIDRAREILGADDCYKVIGCIEGVRGGNKIAILCEHHGVYFKYFSNLKRQGWCCLKCTPPDYGFDCSALSYLYVLDISQRKDSNFIGYGVTGNLNRRLKEHRHYLKSIGATITNIQVFEGSGTAVLAVENAIKSLHTTGLLDCEGFRRESISIDMKDKVLEKCKKLKMLENYVFS